MNPKSNEIFTLCLSLSTDFAALSGEREKTKVKNCKNGGQVYTLKKKVCIAEAKASHKALVRNSDV